MKVLEIKQEEFYDKIQNSKNSKVLVDCYADWCGPCKMLAPIIEDLANEIQNCDFYKINIDNAMEITGKYGIMSIPTLLLFENNSLKNKSVGLISKSELEEFINS